MNVLLLSSKLLSKRVAVALFVLTTMLVGTSMESHAQSFWKSRAFNSNSFRTGQSVKTSNYRAPTPRTGYGANFHRNFVIRQQQQRSQAGGSVIPRGNVLWRR